MENSSMYRPQDVGLNLSSEHVNASFAHSLPRFQTAPSAVREWRQLSNQHPWLRPFCEPAIQEVSKNIFNIHSPLEVHAQIASSTYHEIHRELSKNPEKTIKKEEREALTALDQKTKSNVKQVVKTTEQIENATKGGFSLFADGSMDSLRDLKEWADIVPEVTDAFGVRGTIAKRAKEYSERSSKILAVYEKIKNKLSPEKVKDLGDQKMNDIIQSSERRAEQLSPPNARGRESEIISESKKESNVMMSSVLGIAALAQLTGNTQYAEDFVKTAGATVVFANSATSIFSKGLLAAGTLNPILSIAGAALSIFGMRSTEKRILKQIRSLKKHMNRQFEKLSVSMHEQFKIMQGNLVVLNENLRCIHGEIKIVQEQIQTVDGNLMVIDRNLITIDQSLNARFDLIEEMMGKMMRILMTDLMNIRQEFTPLHVHLHAIHRLTNEIAFDQFWRAKESFTQKFRKLQTEIIPDGATKQVRNQLNYLKFWLTKEVNSRSLAGGAVSHLNDKEICSQVRTLDIESTINMIATSLFKKPAPSSLINYRDWTEGVRTLIHLIESSPQFELSKDDIFSFKEIVSQGDNFKNYLIALRQDQSLFNALTSNYQQSCYLALNVYSKAIAEKIGFLEPSEFAHTLQECLSAMDKHLATPQMDPVQQLMYSFLRSQLQRVLNECQEESKPRGKEGWYHNLFQCILDKDSVSLLPNNQEQVSYWSKIPAVIWFLTLAPITWDKVKSTESIVFRAQKAIIARGLYEVFHKVKPKEELVNLDDLKLICEYSARKNPQKIQNIQSDALLNKQVIEVFDHLNTSLQTLAIYLNVGFLEELNSQLDLSAHYQKLQGGLDLALFMTQTREDPFVTIKRALEDAVGHLAQLQKLIQPHIQRFQGEKIPPQVFPFPIIDQCIEDLGMVTQVQFGLKDHSGKTVDAIRSFFKKGILNEILQKEDLNEILDFAIAHSMDGLIEECIRSLKMISPKDKFAKL